MTHQTTKFATPLEDAFKKDSTINALCYNLTTKEIEHCANRGLEDSLVKKLVVTPLDPCSNAKFAVGFDFEIVLDLREAALSPTTHQSSSLKESHERVGKELSAVIIGQNSNLV